MEQLIEGAGKLGIEFNARQVKHFLDSLTITLALSEEVVGRPDFNIVDIGTGAGFPGVPLKILFPQPRLVLIEPTTKKTSFLHHIIQKLELENVEVLNSRA